MNHSLFKLAILIFLLQPLYLLAQENETEFQTRTSLALRIKPVKKIKLTFTPELRFDQDFKLDESMFEIEADYKPFEIFSFGTSYRFIANQREEKETEYLNRFAFYGEFQKKISDFEFSFRLLYSNYADDEIKDNFIRYRAIVEYNIPKIKVNPFIGFESFYDITEKTSHKNRFLVGTEVKLFSKNYLSCSYKLDMFTEDNLNRHILDIGYKIKF